MPILQPAANQTLVDIAIDTALSFIGKVSTEQFIFDIQRIQFKVIHFYSDFTLAG